MKRYRSIPTALGTVLCALSVLTLAGCAKAPTPVASEAVLIDRNRTLDRIHNRDDSAEFYDESRGGAAVRARNISHVLHNAHYEADAEKLKAKLEAERSAQAAKLEEAAKSAVAQTIQPQKAPASLQRADRSVYSPDKMGEKKPRKTDRSVYGSADKGNKTSEKTPEKDRSVYSKKAPVSEKENLR